MVDMSDDRTGLICGYVFDHCKGSALSWNDMDAALAEPGKTVWLHFNLSDQRARHWIETCERLPQRARDMLLADAPHVRIESMGSCLIGVAGDIHYEAESGDEVGMLHFYVDEHCVISSRRLPLRGANQLRAAVANGLQVRHPLDLIIQLFQYIADSLDQVIERVSEQLDAIEDPILAGASGTRNGELAKARRLAARVRRHLIPQQHALVSMVNNLPGWIPQEDVRRARRAIDHLDVLGHDLDLVQERARLLQEEMSTRLAEETNRNLYVLSIATVVFLPMTLISGIFGMNLGGMPDLQNQWGFWRGMILIGITGLGTVLYLRIKRLM